MRVRIPYSPDDLAFIAARRDMPRKELHAAFVDAFGRRDVTDEHLKSLCVRNGWTTGRAPIVHVEYSREEIEFVEFRQAMSRKGLHAAFAKRFGRPEVTLKQLQGLCTRMGWAKRRNAPNTVWSDEEIAFVEANQTMPRKELYAALVERFGRTDVSEDNFKAMCSRKGFRTGRTGLFEKGAVPANKGKKCPPGVGGRSRAARKTQFRKGNVPHTYRGPGHERVDKDDGYVLMVVEISNPYTGGATMVILKHKWLWEQANGPVPEGYALKCLDGDRTNTDPSNWEAIPRGMLPRLNGKRNRGYDAAPAELKPVIMTVARLEQRAFEIRKNQRAAR